MGPRFDLRFPGGEHDVGGAQNWFNGEFDNATPTLIDEPSYYFPWGKKEVKKYIYILLIPSGDIKK